LPFAILTPSCDIDFIISQDWNDEVDNFFQASSSGKKSKITDNKTDEEDEEDEV